MRSALSVVEISVLESDPIAKRHKLIVVKDLAGYSGRSQCRMTKGQKLSFKLPLPPKHYQLSICSHGIFSRRTKQALGTLPCGLYVGPSSTPRLGTACVRRGKVSVLASTPCCNVSLCLCCPFECSGLSK